jgi:hypothetical protein
MLEVPGSSLNPMLNFSSLNISRYMLSTNMGSWGLYFVSLWYRKNEVLVPPPMPHNFWIFLKLNGFRFKKVDTQKLLPEILNSLYLLALNPCGICLKKLSCFWPNVKSERVCSLWTSNYNKIWCFLVIFESGRAWFEASIKTASIKSDFRQLCGQFKKIYMLQFRRDQRQGHFWTFLYYGLLVLCSKFGLHHIELSNFERIFLFNADMKPIGSFTRTKHMFSHLGASVATNTSRSGKFWSLNNEVHTFFYEAMPFSIIFSML